MSANPDLDAILTERFGRIDAAGDIESIRKAAWFGSGELHHAFTRGDCTLAEHDRASNALTSYANEKERSLRARIEMASRALAS